MVVCKPWFNRKDTETINRLINCLRKTVFEQQLSIVRDQISVQSLYVLEVVI